MISPASRAELIACLRDHQGPLVIVGAGTRRSRPAGDAASVSTLALDRVIEHHPEEMVIVVESGARWDSIDDLLAAHGQRLGVRPLLPEAATLGGLVAADACGPLRHRLGGWRDQLLGIRMALTTGDEIRGGGNVVKNVAGYDLPRLVVGSEGELGALTELSLRLHPRPPCVRTGRLSVADPRALVTQLWSMPLELSACVVDAAGVVLVLLEGREAAVAASAERMDASAPGWRWSEGDELHTDLDARLHGLREAGGVWLAGALPRPAQALEWLGGKNLAAGNTDVAGVRAESLALPATGELWFLVTGETELIAAWASVLRRELESLGGALVAREGELPLDRTGALPPGEELMRGIQSALDPEGKLRRRNER